jgi:hypothetical protein
VPPVVGEALPSLLKVGEGDWSLPTSIMEK